jgi:hypothetical protein
VFTTSRDLSVVLAENLIRAGDAADRVGAEYSVTLCDLGIFVDQATEPVPSQDTDIRTLRGGRSRSAGGLWPSVRCGR